MLNLIKKLIIYCLIISKFFASYFNLYFQVLKVAILAEKYAQDYTWYVDVILNLIRIAGDYVSEEVWYRVIQIVVNREDVQGYAAKTVFEVNYLIILFSDPLLQEIFTIYAIFSNFP